MTNFERLSIVIGTILAIPGAWFFVNMIVRTFVPEVDPSTKPFLLIAAGLLSLLTWLIGSFFWYVLFNILYKLFRLCRH